MRVAYETMLAEFERVLKKYGFTADRAHDAAEIFAQNSLAGVFSHGLNRFPVAVDYLKKGEIDPAAEAECVASFGSMERWDGHRGFGPLNAKRAMDRAVELAKQNGIGLVALIRKLGKHPGIVINPGVSLETVQELFPLVDYVLVMTVDPGFAGRDYLPYVETKIKWLVEIRRQYGFHIVIDGGVTWEVLRRLWGYGVEGFVLGKQILFGQNEPYDKIIQKVRSI